jgi:multidrug resistance efflux pump
MRKITPIREWRCVLAVLIIVPAFQPCAHAQRALKFSPKVLEVLNTPPLEIKDDEDPLVRLKKERYNAALNEAKARFDLYKRGLTKLPDLIEVGERLFGAEVDLYDKPEDRARVLQRQLDVYLEAEGNLERQVKEGLATQADLERLRYNKASLEIDLLHAKANPSPSRPTPEPSPQ